ncbi:hypothetical protein [Janthinobacterium sp. HLX7-2]|uniref:hypothetical protein n=1 Tax=Janthinobacterium sp. HLX7-2 TaxID=1259331 RepID=UPI003F27E7F9
MTIKIKSTDPRTQGDFVVVNRTDFNPDVHEPYGDDQDLGAPTERIRPWPSCWLPAISCWNARMSWRPRKTALPTWSSAWPIKPAPTKSKRSVCATKRQPWLLVLSPIRKLPA